MTYSTNSTHKAHGYYHYVITCPRCGHNTLVRVQAGLVKPWRCPATVDCEQWFKQMPAQYGRKPYVVTTKTPGRARVTTSDDPNKETP